jgi:hypothetical protein
VAGLLLLLAWTGMAHAEPVVEINFGASTRNFLDGRIEVVDAGESFDCSERIWGVVRVNGLPTGDNRLVIHWVSPHEERFLARPITKRVRDSNADVYISAFLELENSLNLVSFMDPAAGLEPYIGEWNAELFSNGVRVDGAPFNVIC